jgi:hypothetical protein
MTVAAGEARMGPVCTDKGYPGSETSGLQFLGLKVVAEELGADILTTARALA